MMSDSAVELVQGGYGMFARGDVEALSALLADTEWHEAAGMPYGGVYNGADAIFQNVFGPIGADIQNFSAQPDEFLDAGDRVIALGRYGGTGGVGPLDVPFAHVWTIAAGKVVKFVQYADTKLWNDATRT